MSATCKVINEHGVNLEVRDFIEDVLSAKRVAKILELDVSRAIGLCCLKLLADETDGIISAVDVVNGFGLPALQWLAHIKNGIKVIANVAKGLQQESYLKLNGENEGLDVRAEDPYVLLHSQKFKFVYVEAIGSAVTFLDAALRSVSHDGLLCVTSTDVAILHNKSPETAVRLYGSRVLKCEYCGELAIRVIVANAVRAAGRWGKGLKVELCAATEHSVTVVFKVLRGAKHVEPLLPLLCTLSHCLNCQARRFNEDVLSINGCEPLCDCGDNDTISAVTQLGPMWSGSIFNPVFVERLLSQANAFAISDSVAKILQLILIESICCKQETIEINIMKQYKKELDSNVGPPVKKMKCDEEEVEPDLTTLETAPALYFDFQHHSVKGGNPPKLLEVILKLRELGHRASKTHFGPRCVRTSATLQEFNDLLKKIWEETANRT